MTVYIEKPAVNLREELASLRNQGGYQEQQFYFDGLLANGTFDTDTAGWTEVDANASVFSGQVTVANSTTKVGSLYQAITTQVGKRYNVTADYISTTSTSAWLTAGIAATGNGRWNIAIDQNSGASKQSSIEFIAVGTTTYIHLLNNSVAAGQQSVWDNISVYETDGTDVIHTMAKGWKPKDVFEDGLLQREGAAHDYEVVYDGFDYVVKPTVAPSATTQTCVIGVKA